VTVFYLSNAANAVLEATCSNLTPQDMGRRFQSLVAAALERHPRFPRLHNNRGAGQPDCHHDPSGYGFEIKCRQSDQPLVLDENGWNALETYRHRRLVTMLAVAVPYPLWVIDLAGWSRRPIALARTSPADTELEAYLAVAISDVVEEVGAGRMGDPRRIEAVTGEESRLRAEAGWSTGLPAIEPVLPDDAAGNA